MGEATQPLPEAASTHRMKRESNAAEDAEGCKSEGESISEYSSAQQLTDGGGSRSKQHHDGHSSVHASGKRALAPSASSAASATSAVPSSPIPSFTSESEPSSSPLSYSPRDSSSGGPPRRRRRKISDLGAGEVWECPLYLCHKRYKKTSIQSIALHKAKCGSRPQLQQLMSQQEEQHNKDRLLQQQSMQLHEQQLRLNRQQEEQQRQMMQLETARQALLMMQQQQHMAQQQLQQQQQPQQQMLQRQSGPPPPFSGQLPFGFASAGPQFAPMSPLNQHMSAAVSAHQLPIQHFALTSSLSYPLPSNDASASSASASLSAASPVTQPAVGQSLQSPTLLPLSIPVPQRPPSAQRPMGVESHYPLPLTSLPFMQPAQLQQPPQQQQSQQHQPQQSANQWPVNFALGGSGSLLAMPGTTMAGGQSMSVGHFGPLMPMPVHLPSSIAAQPAAQAQQPIQPLSNQQPPAVISPPSLNILQQLALQRNQQQSQQQQQQPAPPQYIAHQWLAGVPQAFGAPVPVHFVTTQASSMFVTSSSLSSSSAAGSLPAAVDRLSRPSSQAPAGVTLGSPPQLALPLDGGGTGAGPGQLVLSHLSTLAAVPTLHSPAAAAANQPAVVTSAPSGSSVFFPTFSR